MFKKIAFALVAASLIAAPAFAQGTMPSQYRAGHRAPHQGRGEAQDRGQVAQDEEACSRCIIASTSRREADEDAREEAPSTT